MSLEQEQPAGIGPVERGVGRPVPERDDLPTTVFVVLDEIGLPVFCAAYPQACNDHISEAIVEHDLHGAGLWVVREYTMDTRTRSQKLADAGLVRRPGLQAMEMRAALELIAAPMRPDGTWNRDRAACQELAAEALGRHDDEQRTPNDRAPGCGCPLLADAVAAERERCAKQLEALGCDHCAAALRNSREILGG